MKSPLILRIFRDNKLKEVKQFDQDQIVIGHNADVHLDLEGEGVSAIHCLIELRDAGFYVCDLGSQTGTFKNGQAVLDELIASGDELVIGPYKIQFFVGVPKPKAAPVEEKVAPPVENEVKPAAKIEAAPESKATDKVAEAIVDKVESPKVELPKVIPAVVPTVAPVVAAKVTPSGDVVATAVSKPEIKSSKAPVASGRKKKKGATFAPPSAVKDIKELVKPTKGPLVEVLVCWQERVLNSIILRKKQIVKLGSSESVEAGFPAEFASKGWPILDTTSGIKINLSADMSCEIIGSQGELKNEQLTARIQKNGASASVRLEQGEVIFVRSSTSDLSLAFRYAPQSPAVVMEPPMMLSTSEFTALVLAIVMAGLFKFYIDSITPVDWGVENEEVQRIAEVVFNPPKAKLPEPPKPPEPEPKEEVKPPPPPPPKPPEEMKAQVADKKQQNVKKGSQDKLEQAKKNQVAARASELAPKPNSQNLPKKFSSTRQGGAVKTTDKAGANAQSANKDLNKVGLFSTFGAGGNRAKLDQAYSGSGELLGMADKATGTSGFAEDRAGDDLGSKFKDTGAGGKGTATQGIAGINTKGRGSGMSAYGSVDGFGNKTTVTVDSGGAEEDFVGTIDREAIRRVIRAKLHEVKSCYERALNNKPKGTKFEGKVIIAWEIIARGQARNVKVKSSTLGDSAVENCIRDRLASWIFPEPPEGMTAEVAYPFVLMNQAN